MIRAVVAFVVLCGCSSESAPATDAGPIDGGACPAIAASCPSTCVEWTARQLDPTNKCLQPSATVTCLSPSDGCTGAQTCLVRTTDNVAFWFTGDCHRPGWRACTEAEAAGTDYNSPPCPPP